MTQIEAMKWADEVRRMRNRIERLRGGLKSACGWFIDLDDTEHANKCLEMAGDMEPPLMGSNAKAVGLDAAGGQSRTSDGLCPGAGNGESS